MIYLLDTDTLTLAHRGTHGVGDRIAAARASGEVAVSVVTRIEVVRGRFEAVLKAADGAALARAQELLSSSETYLAGFRVVPFDPPAVAEFDRLREDKKARKAGRNDLLIACIALAHNALLVTRNTKDYKNVAGLRIENWVD